METKLILEIGVGAVLVASLIILFIMTIQRYGAFKLILNQLNRFTNRTELEIELNRRMTIIYTIASNAVYIGLFGTVAGIMLTLQQLTGDNQKEIIASLSVPLLSTAASIVVAIIGTALYNSLISNIETILLKWDIQHGNDIKKS